MTCDRLQDLLSPYIDGELDPAVRAEVEAHLAACPKCAGLTERMKAALDAFAAFPEVEPSPALRRRLLAIPDRPRRRWSLDLGFLRRPALQPVLAAVSGLLLLVSVYLVSPGSVQREVRQQLHRGLSSIERIYVRAESLTGRIGDLANTAYAQAKAANPIVRADY